MSERKNPFVPSSLTEHLAVLRQIGRTSFHVLRRVDQARYVRGLFAELADQGVQPKVHSYLGLYMKACLGDVYHQLTGSSFDRTRFVMHSMRILSVLSIFDHYIDEAGLSLDERVSVFEDLEYAFLKGERRQSRFQQTARATEITCEFHAEISPMPGAEWYFAQCGELLFPPAKEEAFGTPSVKTTELIGRGTLVAIGGILHAHDPQLPRRHIEAYGNFGAGLNLIDDVADFEHDKAEGTKTSITVAPDVEATSRYALARARALFSACEENLRGDEVIPYMALAGLVRAKWPSNLAYGEPSTSHSAAQDPASET